MKIHPVFHVSVLEPCHKSTIPPGRILQPPPPIEIQGHDKYKVEKVLDSQFLCGSCNTWCTGKDMMSTNIHGNQRPIFNMHHPKSRSSINNIHGSPSQAPSLLLVELVTRGGGNVMDTNTQKLWAMSLLRSLMMSVLTSLLMSLLRSSMMSVPTSLHISLLNIFK